MFILFKVLLSTFILFLLFKYEILNLNLINLNNFNPLVIFIIFLFIISMIFLSSLRLYLLLRFFDFKTHLKYIFTISYIGYFFNQCLPGAQGGDLVKIVYIIRKNPEIPKLKIIFYLILDRIIGLLSLLIIFSISIYSLNIFFSELKDLGIFLFVITIIFVIIFFLVFYISKFKNFIFFLLSKIYLHKIINIFYDLSNFISSKKFKIKNIIILVLISIITFIISIICIILLANDQIFTINSIIKIYFISSITFFSNSIPISFNGLGIGEYVFSKLSKHFLGGNVIYYANLFLIYRILIVLASIPGLILFIIFKNKKINND